MADTIYKVLENCEVKKVGERQYEFIASTADMDRDGEVISADGWDLKNFKKNPVILFGHDYRSLPIGKATKIGVRDGKLMNVVEFPPEGTYEFADTVQRLVDTGYLKTQSVGFIPRKWDDGDFEDEKSNKPRRTYTKQELLEISIVPVPSNPNALMNAVKEGVITTKQFETITKPEYECECIECGHKLKSEKHCSEIKCPECGGEMRRAERPGQGKELEEPEDKITKPEEADIDTIGDETPDRGTHKIGQESIMDEIDYLGVLIDKEGLSDKAKEALKELIGRLPADDTAVEDKEETITYQEIQDAIKRMANKNSEEI